MIVGVIQARLGSKRLPGKVLAEIGGRPLIEWTMAAVRPVVDRMVVAIPRGVENDPLAAFLCGKVVVHRGLADDVLARCWDAVAPYAPDIVLRQTADNPFCLTEVMRGQIARIGQYDYVGIAGWPLGIAGEAMTFAALTEAYWNAVTDYDREHVTPYIYHHPERFHIAPSPSFTVDTAQELEAARNSPEARVRSAAGPGAAGERR